MSFAWSMSRNLVCIVGFSFGLFGCGDDTTSSVVAPVAPVPVVAAENTEPEPPSLESQTVPVPMPAQPEANMVPPPQSTPTPSPSPDSNPKPDQMGTQAQEMPAPQPVETVRFIAMGDTGKANDGQRRVADAIAQVCTAMEGCDFVVLLGDNIYDAGAVSAQDPIWETHFEEPYANLDMPFYATLGNHDYGAPSLLEELGGGIGVERARGRAQVAYAATQDKFRMPSEYYRFSNGPVELVSLDTATMFWRDLDWAESTFDYVEVNEGQDLALPQWSTQPLAPWRIAFGHHPYLSNGRHGNAGNYDNVPEGLIGSGTALKAFFEEHVIGDFHAYLAGHEHLLQDLGDVDGTQLIVSGAGASTTEIEWRNEYEWQSESIGFVLIEANPTTLTFRFFEVASEEGAMMPWVESHSRFITRIP